MPRRRSNSSAKVPGTQVSLLTQTSKMPGPSFSLPAHQACPRAAGSICESCYAAKGTYGCPSVQNAQVARFQWTRTALKSPEGKAAWIKEMTQAIDASGSTYFRVHDSGDMFNAEYALMWLAVCVNLPQVRFWIPTRAWQQPGGVLQVLDPLMGVLRRLAALPNVSVRPSALNFGEYAPQVKGLHAGSTAANPDVMRSYQCPAYHQGGECGECRVCWDEKDVPVSYCKH